MVAKVDPGTTATAQQNPTSAPLKCPRCDSINTKFCYYNNYSLSQPRHFCKSCKRYWTRGGTLRNVPIGGGCRKNKRHKKQPLNSSPDAPLKPPHSAPNPLPSLPPPPVDLSSLLYGLLPRQPPSPGFFHVASSSHRSLLNPQIPASSPPVAAAESYSQPLMFYDEWELSKEEPLEAMNSFPASSAPTPTDSSYLYWNQLGAGTNWSEPGFSVAPLI